MARTDNNKYWFTDSKLLRGDNTSSNSDMGTGDLLEHICELEMENKYLKRSIDEMGKIIVQLNAKLTNHQWISVDDKLPEDADDVIVCDEKGRVFPAYCYSYDDGSWYFKKRIAFATEKVSSKITHWKPLPTPPKE